MKNPGMKNPGMENLSMTNMMKSIIVTGFFLLSPMLATADLKVFACEPEWAALAEEIGGKTIKAHKRYQRLAGPALHSGPPQLDFQGSASGYRYLQRRTT